MELEPALAGLVGEFELRYDKVSVVIIPVFPTLSTFLWLIMVEADGR